MAVETPFLSRSFKPLKEHRAIASSSRPIAEKSPKTDGNLDHVKLIDAMETAVAWFGPASQGPSNHTF